VLWRSVLPEWQGLQSLNLVLLCLAIICFPFSVAATNVSLGLLLACGLLTKYWWQGVFVLWQQRRLLLLALAAYLALVLVGLGWSLDPSWGVKSLGRHWFWLLLPIVIMTLSSQKNRQVFLFIMSFGLTANLVFCVLQMNGLVDTAVAGSDPNNATGHIGHTSFGFIYGIWAAWLLHLGLVLEAKYRYLLWGLALWALIMVFMAQGKSGYIVSLVLVLLVASKCFHERGSWKILAAFGLFLALLVNFVLLGPAKDRFQGMDNVLSGNVQEQLNPVQENAVSSVSARLEWWKMSYHMWLDKPALGYGTGSFPKAAETWKANHADVRHYDVALVHPHNLYLLGMVRWGVVGLLVVLSLLFCWIAAGLFRPWGHRVATPLIALSGTALLVHGLSSISLEEHFSTIFALVLLGVGLSEQSYPEEEDVS